MTDQTSTESVKSQDSNSKSTQAPETSELSKDQRTAIQWIATGYKYVDIAKSLNIDVVTLYRWRRFNKAFAAELEDQRAFVREQSFDRLIRLGDTAISSLEQRFTHPDTRLSMDMLRTISALFRAQRGAARETPAQRMQ